VFGREGEVECEGAVLCEGADEWAAGACCAGALACWAGAFGAGALVFFWPQAKIGTTINTSIAIVLRSIVSPFKM
jgi:hypothetical protein